MKRKMVCCGLTSGSFICHPRGGGFTSFCSSSVEQWWGSLQHFLLLHLRQTKGKKTHKQHETRWISEALSYTIPWAFPIPGPSSAKLGRDKPTEATEAAVAKVSSTGKCPLLISGIEKWGWKKSATVYTITLDQLLLCLSPNQKSRSKF